MRIAVAGAHGVGKTTLARALSKELGLPMIEEVVRGVAKKSGYKTTAQIRDASQEDRLKFQEDVLQEQIDTETRFGNDFVSDRSAFDMVAYAILYELPDMDTQIMYLKALRHSEQYDWIVYCPIPLGGSIENDGFRLTDNFSQLAVNSYISGMLQYTKCPVLRLSNVRSNWQRDVLEYLGGDGSENRAC